MQVQKHLFRIAQKSNKSQNAQVCWTLIQIASLIMAVICIVAFAVGELFIKNNLHSLENCFVSNNFKLGVDEVAVIYAENVAPLNKLIANTTAYKNSSFCSIYKNLNGTQITEQSQLFIAGLYSVYRMQKYQKSLLNFDNYTLVLSDRSSIKQFIYSASILFSNQIVSLVSTHSISRLTQSKDVYVKSSTVRFSFHENQESTSNIFGRIFGLVSIVFTYAVSSIITSLYIYVTIISSPAVILLFLQLTPYGRTQAFLEAFKAFPWIGMHSLIYRGSTNLIVRQAYIEICSSLIMYFCVMYLGYYSIVVKISNFFFDQPMESGVGEILFGYFAIIEFAGLVFMRTRPFIKYFPVINTLIIFFFMLYCKFCPMGFKMPAVMGMQFLGIALFSWMVLKLEIPAQKSWNPAQEYVPSLKQPRAGLLPTFNLSWINALPDEWTMLMPLMGREHFTQKQLSFVEQNYEQLSQHLNQR